MNQPRPLETCLTLPAPSASKRSRATRACTTALAVLALLVLSACGGGGGGGTVNNADSSTPAGSGSEPPAQPSVANRPSQQDAARLLTQATFGATSIDDIEAVRVEGFERWLWNQFNTPAMSHTGYLDAQRTRNEKNRATDEMSYEAIWQQWLTGADQLRARVSFALGQIVVISNVAPDLRPYAMSSYLDMLNRNAFGNYRTLLKDVTLHPAMGYYLNMMKSEKDDPEQGIHPNENYAREVLQLFSIGLVELNPDGSAKLGSDGKPIPTYGEAEVKGFAKAFSGWTFASQDPAKPSQFHKGDENLDSNWTTPMRAFASKHSPEAKKLLGSTVLPAGQTPEKDLEDAIDVIFNHPNVGPFIGRQLIQRLVTSNPSHAYIGRVAAVFNNNGAGVRGDLKSVVQAILLDPEARTPAPGGSYGKQREPVIRFAHYLRALGARSSSGINAIHYLDSADDGLGQSPLLAPSVFNFFSPNFRQPGTVARAGLYSPEFQITTETSVVGSLNFFANLIHNGGYGWDDNRLVLNTKPLEALANDPVALVARIDALFFGYQMGASTRERMTRMLAAMPSGSDYQRKERVQAALIVTAMSPDYVIQK
ncbi:MAG: DUF1800 domain-containing protein [Rhodoferax sp.]|nr:DUF1800 domain-containing protein [Rhodoferax sp.]